MEEREIKADVVSYNTLLHVCLDHLHRRTLTGEEEEDIFDREQDSFDREDIFEREERRILALMASHDIAADMNTMHTRIRAAARRHDLRKVRAVVAEMSESERTAPTDTTFALVAEGCGLIGDIAGAEKMLARMAPGPQGSAEALRIAHTAVMRAYAVRERPDEALRVALAASRAGVQVGEGGWGAMLNVWADVGDVDAVLSALAQMSTAGAKPSHIHWTIAVKAACRSGEAKACTRALALMKDKINKPDVVCFNTIISAALKTRDIDSLVIALREMEQQGVEPDKYTRQAMECAGASAAMLKIGGLLGSFSSRFKRRLANAVVP